MSNAPYRKKLIEVALPLDAINNASAREKSIRHGHPSTLHLWWARRPLAACRAVLFASLVNDPEDDPDYGISEDTAYTERANLFDLIEELVLWENSNNPDVINRARLEIARSIAANKVADGELANDANLVAGAPELPEEQAKYLPEPPAEYTPNDLRFKMPSLTSAQVNHFLAHYAPPVLDPFAGGGSIPLEAQRLGLRAYASDLNPVPVLINKALIEIPPKFAGLAPVNPDAQKGKLKTKVWNGAEGLAEDVRYYGKWMREEAEKRIGHLYPKVKVTQQMVDDGRPDLEPYVGQELTVIAWLWARTVKSPNPAAKGAEIPLIRSFLLSNKKGAEHWIEPIVDGLEFSTAVRRSSDKPPQGTISKSDHCLLTKAPLPRSYIREQGKSVGLGQRMMAIVVEGKTRQFVAPNATHASSADVPMPETFPDASIDGDDRYQTPVIYGMNEYSKLFTPRQLTTLSTFSSLLERVHAEVIDEAKKLGRDLNADQYADAVVTFLAFALDKGVDYWSTLATWASGGFIRGTFARQALSMSWDFAECNPFSESTGNWLGAVHWVTLTLENLVAPVFPGIASQCSATDVDGISDPFVLSTDPPYYDNVPYSDLSDYFYIWLRNGIGASYPNLLNTLLTPKQDELVADAHRQGDADSARQFFENGMADTFQRMNQLTAHAFPATIFYAFKQSERDEGSDTEASTGWETFLQGVIEAKWAVTGTWPVRTERSVRTRGIDSNALASSIVLVCRPRAADAPMVTRRDFANALRKELPEAIKHLQSGNVAPVDLAQASIGPGMAVFSRYSKVVNADGSPMSVREALQLINQVLDEALAEQESDFDAETRFALKWFEQFGMTEGPFGDANTLANAMAVSVEGVQEAGICKSGGGKVKLLARDELQEDWDPATDSRLTMWEVTQYLIRALESSGETGAADLLRRVGNANGEIARELAYRLYQTCERKSLAKEAGAYNALVVSWPEITKLARQQQRSEPQQAELDLTE